MKQLVLICVTLGFFLQSYEAIQPIQGKFAGKFNNVLIVNCNKKNSIVYV